MMPIQVNLIGLNFGAYSIEFESRFEIIKYNKLLLKRLKKEEKL